MHKGPNDAKTPITAQILSSQSASYKPNSIITTSYWESSRGKSKWSPGNRLLCVDFNKITQILL